MIILGFDALDLSMVKKYNCKNLIQVECGQTDISEFELPRTVVLWASFLAGKNLEAMIPVKTQWEFKLGVEETFFRFFRNFMALDVPAFSLKEKNHAEERRLLKAYFDEKASVEEYDAVVWRSHEENKKDFLSSLGKHDLFMGYFDLADAIGHLSFGIEEKMKAAYTELEDLAREVIASGDEVLVVSDHGMKAVGRYGDHTRNGFYSTSHKLGLNLPKITDFYEIVKGVA